jgi:glycogen debranching enzyme
MIPNRIPDVGEDPEYNTVDATLWFFTALYKYLQHTGDCTLARELWPALKDIAAWHQRGTRFEIKVDDDCSAPAKTAYNSPGWTPRS